MFSCGQRRYFLGRRICGTREYGKLRIPQLLIRTVDAKIAMDTIPARLEIRQPKAEMYQRQPHGILEIESRNVEVLIDNYPTRYDLGFRNMRDLAREWAARGRQAALKAIGQYAEDGDRLRQFHIPGNTIELIAVERAKNEPREIGLKPVRGPEFTVIPPELSIRYTAQEPELIVHPKRPEFNYFRGDVVIKMVQYPRVEIEWVGRQVDIQA